ncbi:hypothetical protein M758_4G211300 [Ceratodon purpureus]|nr:hypothetical protein M758_4G211300 [Ceratodon purpureus]
MESLSVAGACVGSASPCNIDRNLSSRCVPPNNSPSCQVLARNSASYLGHTFLPKRLSFSCSSRGRYERGVPSALLNSHEYNKQKLEKAQESESDSDDDLCPIECVREISTLRELEHILNHAKSVGSLVVVDFFRTSCGSCRYIEKGFQKLCKGAGSGEASVVFLKHNVFDEYEEQSDIADKFRIKVVPLFHFYKGGELVESFPTRDKARILETIYKHLDVKQTIEEWSDLHGLK